MRYLKSLVLILCLIIASMLMTGCGTSPEAGTAGVVHNGGPIDNKAIRDNDGSDKCSGTIKPNTGWQWAGLFSTVRYYPDADQQRFITLSSDPDKSDSGKVDTVNVETSDGYFIQLDAQLLFETVFDGSCQGVEALKHFDRKFGNRKFNNLNRDKGSPERISAWDGDDGWEAFLSDIIQPKVGNALRFSISKRKCVELVPSCAYVVQGSVIKAGDGEAAPDSEQSNQKIEEIQEEVAKAVADELTYAYKDKDGKSQDVEFFANIEFNITTQPSLAPEITKQVKVAQGAFADIATQNASLKANEIKKRAGLELAELYEKSPGVKDIHMIQELKAMGKDGPPVEIFIGIQPAVTSGRR